MPQTDKRRKRTNAVRQCQAERRKHLKTLTVEVDKEMHGKVKTLAAHKKKTVQGLLFDTLSSMVDSEEKRSRPWGVFDPLRNEVDCERTHVSLFSGCGGADLGFRQAGFKTVFANDVNADACATYRENLGAITEGDIRTVSLSKIPKRPDVLSAGFPCQPFSNAGSRRGVEDDRGTLYQAALDAVKKLKPRAVLFENVRGAFVVQER